MSPRRVRDCIKRVQQWISFSLIFIDKNHKREHAMVIDDEISILWLRRCLRLQKAFHPRPIDEKKASKKIQ